ncbi:hypothetical protein DFH07DRAFT_999512, partial [Mycena maculata]
RSCILCRPAAVEHIYTDFQRGLVQNLLFLIYRTRLYAYDRGMTSVWMKSSMNLKQAQNHHDTNLRSQRSVFKARGGVRLTPPTGHEQHARILIPSSPPAARVPQSPLYQLRPTPSWCAPRRRSRVPPLPRPKGERGSPPFPTPAPAQCPSSHRRDARTSTPSRDKSLPLPVLALPTRAHTVPDTPTPGHPPTRPTLSLGAVPLAVPVRTTCYHPCTSASSGRTPPSAPPPRSQSSTERRDPCARLPSSARTPPHPAHGILSRPMLPLCAPGPRMMHRVRTRAIAVGRGGQGRAAAPPSGPAVWNAHEVQAEAGARVHLVTGYPVSLMLVRLSPPRFADPSTRALLRGWWKSRTVVDIARGDTRDGGGAWVPPKDVPSAAVVVPFAGAGTRFRRDRNGVGTTVAA